VEEYLGCGSSGLLARAQLLPLLLLVLQLGPHLAPLVLDGLMLVRRRLQIKLIKLFIIK
jgi:hypothetical protein